MPRPLRTIATRIMGLLTTTESVSRTDASALLAELCDALDATRPPGRRVRPGLSFTEEVGS
jgi:hypothetical protein